MKLRLNSRGDYFTMQTLETEMGGESIFQEEDSVFPTRSRGNGWCVAIKPTNTTIL